MPSDTATATLQFDRSRIVAVALGVGLTIAAISGLVPGLADDQGRTFGLFKLNAYQNLLHAASAAWAFSAAVISRRASVDFLRIFGTLYLLDGVMGVAIGSGYLDLGVVRLGVLDLPLGIKLLTSLPHLILGGVGSAAGFRAKR